ncbi:branched-chain amino acid transporter permease [Spirillospora sp. CA-128828]|uniref:branched-chain amino acid transporter permease n=1 Tax=Spirillospora sp. CA-128828 TaxID=3240033 RepID=UPI003D94D306
MPDSRYAIAAIIVAAAVTWALRALPFAALAPLRASGIVRYLNTRMPAGVMAILVVYCLRDPATATAGGSGPAGRPGGHHRPAPVAPQRPAQHPRRHRPPRRPGQHDLHPLTSAGHSPHPGDAAPAPTATQWREASSGRTGHDDGS